jgi:multisubunit Na+/H+ antiporter MnhG subunit
MFARIRFVSPAQSYRPALPMILIALMYSLTHPMGTRTIEAALIEHGVTLHFSRRMKKYVAGD